MLYKSLVQPHNLTARLEETLAKARTSQLFSRILLDDRFNLLEVIEF